MAANSEIILSAQTHLGDSTSEVVIGDKYKGDGYYGRSDGIHTVQYNLSEFTGTIIIEGTLEVNPTDTDWFSVHSYASAQETDNKIVSFTGNYVWVRAKIVYTDGTLNSIILNH